MMKTHKWLVLAGATLWMAGGAFADGTNDPGHLATPIPEANSLWAATVAQDVGKLVYDVLTGFSLSSVLQAFFVTYFGAKGLRNYTRLGQGWPGKVLRLINLEIQEASAVDGKPTQPAMPPVVSAAEEATKTTP
jgi:hypothetical protein